MPAHFRHGLPTVPTEVRQMHFRAVLNRCSGTFSAMDLGVFTDSLTRRLREAGHSVDVEAADGNRIVEVLREACLDDNAEVIMAGGGDGTVSLAAGLAVDSGKILAILPAGTMNLFARSLGIPLDLDAAIAGVARADMHQVDIARVNGRPFVHQFSIGMHPQLIHLRSQIPFRGRLGKLAASIRAAVATLMSPHNLQVAISMGETELVTVTPSISVTNNLYGEGHLPFADRPDGGILGIYITQARRPVNLIAHFLSVAMGRWQENEQVEIHEAGEVRLKILSPHRRYKCSVDGELCPLEEDIHIRLHPKALSVLIPTRE